jgi:hypothetical protein
MHFNKDIGTLAKGRSIGGGHDQSAPTDGRISLLNAIIGPYGWPDYVVKVHYCALTSPGGVPCHCEKP